MIRNERVNITQGLGFSRERTNGANCHNLGHVDNNPLLENDVQINKKIAKFLLIRVLYRLFSQFLVDLALVNKMVNKFLLIQVVQCPSQQKNQHFFVHFYVDFAICNIFLILQKETPKTTPFC